MTLKRKIFFSKALGCLTDFKTVGAVNVKFGIKKSAVKNATPSFEKKKEVKTFIIS